MPGGPADATTPIALQAGLNWIGYLPEQALDVNTALAELHPTPGDQIKSQHAFAHYVAGTGWVGSLSEMEPGQGYVLNVAEAATLRYPKARGTPQTAPATRVLAANGQTLGQQTDDKAEMQRTATRTKATWHVDEAAYRYSMTITGTIALNHSYGLGILLNSRTARNAIAKHCEMVSSYEQDRWCIPPPGCGCSRSLCHGDAD